MFYATAETEWWRGIFEELTSPRFIITEWREHTRHRGLYNAASTHDPDATTQNLLYVMRNLCMII